MYIIYKNDSDISIEPSIPRRALPTHALWGFIRSVGTDLPVSLPVNVYIREAADISAHITDLLNLGLMSREEHHQIVSLMHRVRDVFIEWHVTQGL